MCIIEIFACLVKTDKEKLHVGTTKNKNKTTVCIPKLFYFSYINYSYCYQYYYIFSVTHNLVICPCIFHNRAKEIQNKKGTK